MSDTPSSADVLELGHTSENTVFPFEQFIGTAFLDDLPVSKDYDLISSLHGSHTMGDDQNGLPSQEPRQCTLNLCFVLYIE